MDFEQFRVRFPEFDRAPQSMVEAALADAALQVDPCVYRAKTALAIGYLAAHTLSVSPYARTMRPAENAQPGYLEEFQRITRQVTIRMFVV